MDRALDCRDDIREIDASWGRIFFEHFLLQFSIFRINEFVKYSN